MYSDDNQARAHELGLIWVKSSIPESGQPFQTQIQHDLTCVQD